MTKLKVCTITIRGLTKMELKQVKIKCWALGTRHGKGRKFSRLEYFRWLVEKTTYSDTEAAVGEME